jgi:hypothetical protein
MSKMMDKMIILGAVEVAGVNEKGELRYSLSGSLDKVLPDLYRAHIDEVHEQMLHFWELGFVEFLDMDRSAPRIKLTRKVMDQDAVEKLDEEHQEALFNLINAFREEDN